MSRKTELDRRLFLRGLVTSAAAFAVGSAAGLDASPQVAAPKNVRIGTDLSGRSLIGMNDLAWQGMAHMPDTGFSYASGQIAVRYVSGQRRLLMAKWHRDDGDHKSHGDICEIVLPTLAVTSANSQPVTVGRSWSNWTWVPTGDLLSSLSNGWLIGAIWWQDRPDWGADQGVIWYTMYPYYAPGVVMPFLGATRLNDDGTVTKYGPWHYDSNTTTAYKGVIHYFVPIPRSAQADCGGRTMAMGATCVGASGGEPVNWGPGLTAISLPALTSSNPVPAGLPLIDYRPNAGGLSWPYFHMWREADYVSVNLPLPSSAVPAPIGNTGFWQGSADSVGAVAWLETSTKHGLIVLGQRAAHANWYGLDNGVHQYRDDGSEYIQSLPATINGVAVNPDMMALSQGSWGYHSDRWQSAFWLFDPVQIREVARRVRKASADGMRPVLLGQWNTVWTAIPRPQQFPYVADIGTSCVDPVTGQLIWAISRSKVIGYGVLPTIHVFSLPA